jgi:hypothetical protein
VPTDVLFFVTTGLVVLALTTLSTRLVPLTLAVELAEVNVNVSLLSFAVIP